MLEMNRIIVCLKDEIVQLIFLHYMTVKEEQQLIEISDDHQIYISGRIWHELYPKVNPTPFLRALRKGIDLTKYGAGINKFYFTFIVEKNNDIIDFSGTYFDPETKEAEIAVAIDYDQALKASESERIKLMEKAYLEGIDLIETLPLPSEFDIAAFKKDVALIFAQASWWEDVMEPGL